MHMVMIVVNLEEKIILKIELTFYRHLVLDQRFNIHAL